MSLCVIPILSQKKSLTFIYIASYFYDYNDDDDDDVKTKMIPVIIETTGTISMSSRKYLRNITGKHKIKEVEKKKNRHIGHCKHT